MLTVKAMTGGEGYAANHLSNSDYYSVGETVTGQWIGRGAELLGLEGAVTMEQFEAIRQAIDPSTGEFLRQRQSADRYGLVERNGVEALEKIQTSRNLYDFTVSAPKGLSVLAMEDQRVLEAHNTGVAAIAAEIELQSGARIRKYGANDTRITSNLVIARYNHTASRALDPQIHTHLVAANLTYDGVEGKWKALDATEIYQQTSYLTEVYRNNAAQVLNRLGYQIQDRFEHGKDNGFGIVGIQEATLEKFSQRTAQKEAAIAEFIRENGRQPSKNEISRLVRETRERKLTEITTAEVIAGQRARMSPEEAHTLQGLRQAAIERGSIQQQAPAGPSLNYASEHIFERVSVAKDYELKTEALRHGRGRIELPELKGAVLAEVASGAMLTARGEVATQETLERERRMVATVNEGIRQYQPLGRSREFVVSDRLRPEQKAAVLAALGSRDLVFNISGAAGAGKTNLLQDLQRGLNEARRSVVAVAPSTSAVEQLQKEGFPQAITMAELLVSPQKQAALRGQVLIVDEAGMVGSKDMDKLLKLAQSQDARVLTVGDTKQIKSVQQGDALRILERGSDMNGVSVREVLRQTNAEYKAAVEALRNHPAEGFEKLEKMGAIREVHWRERGIEVSKAYREASAVPNANGQVRSVLVTAATHEEIRNITHAIRADLKRDGQLGEGQTFVNHTPLNWTEAQKKQTKNYQPGQVLEFHKTVNGVNKNEALEVVSAGKSGITARRAIPELLCTTFAF
jgi:conjugative relaxase-like TrwC/TraI family protein